MPACCGHTSRRGRASTAVAPFELGLYTTAVRVGGLLVAALLGTVVPARALSLEKILGGGQLVAYRPRNADGRPSARVLRTDAESLAAVGFRAVTTYGTSRATAPVCRFFKRRGFRSVLVGIADPRDAGELRRAVRLRRCADGYVVGSNGPSAARYTRSELEHAIARVRAASGRPVTTRETAQAYRDDPSLARMGDWLFPAIQPWEAGKRDPQDACGWTIFAYRELAERAPAGMPTVIAETGLPTEGALATSEHYQRAFFLCLASRQVPFGYFEAVDRSPGADAVEAHWGLFRADGSPKLWAAQQIRPALVVERAGGMVRGRVENGPRHILRVIVYVQGARWDAAPPLVPDRRGAWELPVSPDRPVAVYVGTLAWTPPAAVDRLPRVDRVQILAARELPAM